MMKRFVDVGLFENIDGKITCLKVAKRLMGSATSNPEMRKMIQNIKLNHDSVMTASDYISADKNRLDKITIDKTKPSMAVDENFELFWKEYPKKVGKEAARKSWNSNKPPIDLVLDSLIWQKRTTQWNKSDGQYIPNPATWINQGRWQDEVQEDSADAWINSTSQILIEKDISDVRPREAKLLEHD